LGIAILGDTRKAQPNRGRQQESAPSGARRMSGATEPVPLHRVVPCADPNRFDRGPSFLYTSLLCRGSWKGKTFVREQDGMGRSQRPEWGASPAKPSEPLRIEARR